jgi:hypothetical protein
MFFSFGKEPIRSLKSLHIRVCKPLSLVVMWNSLKFGKSGIEKINEEINKLLLLDFATNGSCGKTDCFEPRHWV